MKRNKVNQSEATKYAKREARARAYLARINVDCYQSFGKVIVDGLMYPDYQSAARLYDPEWWRKVPND